LSWHNQTKENDPICKYSKDDKDIQCWFVLEGEIVNPHTCQSPRRNRVKKSMPVSASTGAMKGGTRTGGLPGVEGHPHPQNAGRLAKGALSGFPAGPPEQRRGRELVSASPMHPKEEPGDCKSRSDNH
jgi:hypothetical protein